LGVDIPVILPSDDMLDLSSFFSKGPQPNEDLLPEESVAAPGLPEFNQAALDSLSAMGFSQNRSRKALLATGNSDPEAAMEWLFAHMDDPDIDVPIVASAAGSKQPEPPAEQVAMLAEMGFTHAQARKALRETDGDPERAVEWLFSHPDDNGEAEGANTGSDPIPASGADSAPSVGGRVDLPARFRLKAFVSHKGPSVHSGHYVAHIRVAPESGGPDEGWVLFNDEKVVKADAESVRELKKLAYLYVFEHV
jgi:ubiquitin carboxyl-terminal hydrolase 5/13